MSRPEYFNVDFKMGGYTFYRNEEGRVYVPEEEKDFNDFIDTLYGIVIDPTDEQTQNYLMIKKYPFLLPKNRWDKGLDISSEYSFDFTYTETHSMPKGWFKAFGIKMLDEIREFMLLNNPKFLYQYTITDIKEKYGGLRWYDEGTPEGMYEIINKYTKLSYYICVWCGEVATHTTDGWIMPVCDECDIMNQPNKKPHTMIDD